MLTVRPGTGLDEEAAVRLWQVDAAQRGRRSGGALAQRFRALLRSPGTLLLVAERDGAPTGVLVATLHDDDGVATPGLLHLAVAVGERRPLLQALLQRYPRLSARVPDDDADLRLALELAGLRDHPDGVLRTPS